MNKLIKLSDTHYIVVDDSEIKEVWEGFAYKHDIEGKVFKHFYTENEWYKDAKKITHSTQPLEPSIKSDKHNNPKEFVLIKPLSLSEVEEAIYGYSVENIWEEFNTLHNIDIPLGKEQFIKVFRFFNVHKELVKDKLFTVEDMKNAIKMARQMKDDSVDDTFDVEDISGCTEVCTYGWRKKHSDEQIIQSLLPKTEWDCCISDGKLVIIN